MLRWIRGISLKYHVRSGAIKKRAKVKPIVDHATKRRLTWYVSMGEGRGGEGRGGEGGRRGMTVYTLNISQEWC